MKIKKIKQKIKNKVKKYLNRIQDKPTKIIYPLIFGMLLFTPLRALAAEGVVKPDSDVDAKKGRRGGVGSLVSSTIGLKECFDPTVPLTIKAVYCTKPCCVLAGLTAGCIADNSPVGSKIHKAATLCCLTSWSVYSYLVFACPSKLEGKAKQVIPLGKK